MLKIMVVEDEDMIRNVIVSIIDENKGDDFTIIAQAEDGEQALEKMKKEVPDILITDIKMPFMDGIVLTEQVKEAYPNMYVIILSGYDEFDFAQRAVKIGVYDYLLKPINTKDLMEVLGRIKRNYEAEKAKKDKLDELKQLERDNQQTKRKRLLQDLLVGKTAYDQMSPQEQDLLAATEYTHYTAGLANIENIALATISCDYLELLELDAEFTKMSESIWEMHPNVHVFEDKLCEYVVLIETASKGEVRSLIRQIRNEFYKARTQDMYIRTSFGDTVNAASQLRSSYQQAVASRGKEYLSFDDFIAETNVPATDELDYMDFNHSELLAAVRMSDKSKIDQEMKKLEEQMEKQKVISYLHMVMVGTRIYFDVGKLLAEVTSDADELLLSDLENFHRLLSKSNPKDIVAQLKKYCYKVSDLLEEATSGKFARVLLRAEEYIKSNFMNEDLMLEDVARNAFVSTSYLSIIFKKEAGETFIEYLTRTRMENAARLLRKTDLKNYEVAERSGYSNPTYFSTIFKKYFDMPPSTYKKKHRKSQVDKE